MSDSHPFFDVHFVNKVPRVKYTPVSALLVQAFIRFFCWLMVAPAGVAVSADSVAAASVVPHELSGRRALYEGEGGTSCADYLGGVLPWERPGGDWRDARGKLFGDQPYAETKPGLTGATWDVTALVRKWVEAGTRRGGVVVRALGTGGNATFHSREARSPTDWPILIVELTDGRREMLKPTADTHLSCSTYRPQGRSETLRVVGTDASLLQFDLPATVVERRLVRAQLVLFSAAAPRANTMRLGVFEMATPSFPASAVHHGLAADYPADKGIERNPNVVFASGFDEWSDWRSRWAKASTGDYEVVKDDWDRRFEPLAGNALRVRIKKGRNSGADLRLYLKELGGEVDELYFRYYLRLADDWDPTVEGGKLPGLAGTYGEAGWGGRRSDGTKGWSLRGAFLRAFPSDHPFRGLTQLSTYAYHADMKDFFGDAWIWPGALLERNRWYSIEQQVRLNRPGLADGMMRVWVDGRLVMERQNIRLRTVDQLRIETVWLNVYHGGVAKSPQDQHLYVDNVVVARNYIGPLAVKPSISK